MGFQILQHTARSCLGAVAGTDSLDASSVPGRAAPARPLSNVGCVTPLASHQQLQQKNRWRLGPASALAAGPAASIDQLQEDEQEADETAEPLPGCRWLACCYKAGQLGLAAYDRLSNEVRSSWLACAALAGQTMT